jgi:hypothetical protein
MIKVLNLTQMLTSFGRVTICLLINSTKSKNMVKIFTLTTDSKGMESVLMAQNNMKDVFKHFREKKGGNSDDRTKTDKRKVLELMNVTALSDKNRYGLKNMMAPSKKEVLQMAVNKTPVLKRNKPHIQLYDWNHYLCM